MSPLLAAFLFLIGLALVLVATEKLIEGTVGTAVSFGLSTFLVSVLFFGFDPDNLAVGVTGIAEGSDGIALGAVFGAAMVAITFALGVTAVIVPLHLQRAPRALLALPVLAVVLLGALCLDGQLSRLDGALLLFVFVLAIVFLLQLERRGYRVEAAGEVAEALDDAETMHRWKALALLVGSLVAIVLGSEMLVTSAQVLIAELGISETVVGMTVLAFLVSIEELTRELAAALKGRPEITFGNVVGAALASFLFNAGWIALVRPVVIGPSVLRYYLPVCTASIVLIALLMLRGRIRRRAGALLVLVYVFFAAGAILWG